MSIQVLTNTCANPNPKIFNYTSICKSNFNGICSIKFRVYAKTKDFGAKVANRQSSMGTCDKFSAPVKPINPTTPSSSPKQRKEDEDKQNYHLNVGYAIRSLREEFPELFDRDLTFDIYRDDIVFIDPRNTVAGIENYKSIFWALRFQGKIFFKDLWLEILRVWQPAENVIVVRWTVHGIPRVPWEAQGRFDGISEYKLDRNGKIYEHKVDNIAFNSPTKFQMLSVEELIESLGCASATKPNCFEFSSSSSNFTPLVETVKSIMHYLASALGLMERSKGRNF